MALRMLRFPLLLPALALLAAVAGCPGPSARESPRATPTEVPPTTKDPGAVEDERPLQPSVEPEPEGGSAAEQARRSSEPDGAPCLSGEECASGICEGEGCAEDRPGTCAPRSRACTRDLRPYCGCDGKTFRASGTCPGRRYATRAACGS